MEGSIIVSQMVQMFLIMFLGYFFEKTGVAGSGFYSEANHVPAQCGNALPDSSFGHWPSGRTKPEGGRYRICSGRWNVSFASAAVATAGEAAAAAQATARGLCFYDDLFQCGLHGIPPSKRGVWQ